MPIPVSDIVESIQALMNDTQGQNFTFAAVVPYMNIAIAEFRQVMEANNISMTNAVQAGIIIEAGETEIDPLDMPRDLVEIQKLAERIDGTDTDYLDMRRVEFLPNITPPIAYLVYWTYQDQKIKFLGATSNIEIKMDYIADVMPKVRDVADEIEVINAETFLMYRTAALASQYIGENKERADDLNYNAQLAIDRFSSINVKAKQSIYVRRRPFMAAYKSRRTW